MAYAAWAGLRLPTEAEWEKAAAGPTGRKHPWGTERPSAARANYGRRFRGTTPVDAHPAGATPRGVHDLVGNVWEWCADVDEPDFYRHGPDIDPRNLRGPEDPTPRVVRGGSWLFDDPRALRCTSRRSFAPDRRAEDLGFRCAR